MDLARRNGEAMAVGVGRRLDIGTTANIWRVIQRYHDEGFDDGEILYTQHSSLRSAEERLESYFGVELTDSVFFDDILGDKTGWVYIYVHADDSDDDDDDDYDEGLYYERSCYDQYDRRQGPCKAYCGYSEEEEEKEEEDYACESREVSSLFNTEKIQPIS